MEAAFVGVIGGSGVYEMEGLADVQEMHVKTPFGDPSDAIVVGTLDGVRVAFLPRHGRGHFITPSELPSRANIYALKSLGVQRIIGISACGSMREDIAPLHVVIPDQLLDRTKNRPSTFFGNGIVAHISFAEPYCADMTEKLYHAATAQGATVHKGGTMIVIEGPAFSTKAESAVYRSWGVDVIGMTALPEAKLAREAEICYATLALVTDYDVWHEVEEGVTVGMILENLQKNAAMSKKIIRAAVKALAEPTTCDCSHALETAIITNPAKMPAATKEKLNLLIGKYVR
jgi:5'-methylthioadenosine phosphorylase